MYNLISEINSVSGSKLAVLTVLFTLGLGGNAFGQNILGSAPTANSKYGALAYSETTGSWGWAVDHTTKASAGQAALSKCGKSCEVVFNFWNTCGAFAKGSTSKGWAIGNTASEAQSKAVNVCDEKSEDDDCEVKIWGCTTRY